MKSNIPIEFQFTIPEISAELSMAAKIAIQMGAFSSRLVAVERTRCVHPDGRAENDAEHSLMLAKVAPELSGVLYPDLDENLVARFATIHDDVEAYVGDTPTDMLGNLDASAKQEREAEALTQLTTEYAHMPRYVQLVRQYEAQEIPEARFVRAVDKLMVLLIHFPNQGVILQANYSYESFMQSEQDLLARDAYKYGGFASIMDLRRELAVVIAEKFLR